MDGCIVVIEEDAKNKSVCPRSIVDVVSIVDTTAENTPR